MPQRRAALVASTVFLCGACAPAAHALDGYLTLASSYSFRGVVLDKGPTLLAGAEQRIGDAWAIGGWAAGVDRAWPFERASAGWVAGAYVAYDGACGARCRVRTSVSRYVYPDSRPAGWNELAVAVRWRERFGVQTAVSRRDDDAADFSRTLEVFAEQPLFARVDAALTLGYSDYADFGYRYAELDFSRTWGRWRGALGARYGEVRPPAAAARSDARLLAQVTIAF